MPKFKVFATWQMCDEFDVEAETLYEAIEKVYENEDDEYCIGGKGEYVDDSFEIDHELSETCSKRYYPAEK